ncbi:MAG: restriction endonuclease subunit S [Desulfovibrionaceae bacterium]|nr:restriction endonuclease subunit S [Desulfovibrionaceae bacterium]
MTAEQLKASILQMAIEGRLVPQRDDEPAVDIAGEEPEDVPFAIPENWKWVRLSDVGITQTGTTPATSNKNFYGSDVPFVKPGDIVANKVFYRKDGLSKAGAEVGRIAPSGSVLMVCIGGTIGKVCLVDREVSFNQQINAISPNIHCALEKYIYFALSSDYFYKEVRIHATGTATPIIKKSTWQSLALPLPPLAEQRRIVARLEELLPLVEEYGNAHAALKKTEEALPDHLRASLLQEAIQGKLVPQIDDEPAVDIAGEEPEDVPFAIPEKWRWVRLRELVAIATGKKDANYGSPDGEYPFFTCSNKPIKSKYYSYDGEFLIMPGNGANIGRVIYYNGKFEAYQRTYLIRALASEIDLSYLKVHLESNWKKYNLDKMYGSAIPFIKLGNLKNYPVALPPLAEQRRIVARLEELLPHVDAIR